MIVSSTGQIFVGKSSFNDNYDLIVSKIKDKKLYNCELTSAKELWKKLLRIYIETGDLYIVCKDAGRKTGFIQEQAKQGVNLNTG